MSLSNEQVDQIHRKLDKLMDKTNDKTVVLSDLAKHLEKLEKTQKLGQLEIIQESVNSLRLHYDTSSKITQTTDTDLGKALKKLDQSPTQGPQSLYIEHALENIVNLLKVYATSMLPPESINVENCKDPKTLVMCKLKYLDLKKTRQDQMDTKDLIFKLVKSLESTQRKRKFYEYLGYYFLVDDGELEDLEISLNKICECCPIYIKEEIIQNIIDFGITGNSDQILDNVKSLTFQLTSMGYIMEDLTPLIPPLITEKPTDSEADQLKRKMIEYVRHVRKPVSYQSIMFY
ncbi:hypothetical protein MHBO_002427 [Bonamia ostreae]|uniref:Uncharacterized protein n=1 Tax=Bonamia ostreae TaxID=126728 RepID=A0ABV2AM88_9EUKA